MTEIVDFQSQGKKKIFLLKKKLGKIFWPGILFLLATLFVFFSFFFSKKIFPPRLSLAAIFQFSENFSTTKYKDQALTTATWDTNRQRLESQKLLHQWTTTSYPGYGLDGGNITSLALSPNFQNDHTVYIYYSGHLAKSTDKGESWTTFPTNLTQFAFRGFVALSPTYDETTSDCSEAGGNWHKCTILVASEGGYPMVSFDKGQTWTVLDSHGVNNHARSLAFSPNFATDHTVFIYDGRLNSAPWEAGVYKSTTMSPSGAKTFTRYTNGLPLASGWNSDTMAVALDGTMFIGLDDGRVYKSTDQGENWSLVATIAGAGQIEVFAISPSYNDSGSDGTLEKALWAGTDNGVYRSYDGGSNWTAVNSGLGIHHVREPNCGLAIGTCPATSNCHLYVGGLDSSGNFSEIYQTSDAGDSWSVWKIDPNYGPYLYTIIAVSAANPDIVFVGSADGQGVFRYENGQWDRYNRRGLYPSYWQENGGVLALTPNYGKYGLPGYNYEGLWFGSYSSVTYWPGLDWYFGYDRGSGRLDAPDPIAVRFSPNYKDDGTVFVADSDIFPPSRLWKNTNFGASPTWEVIGAAPSGQRISFLALSPNYDEREANCAANPSKCTLFVATNRRVFKSTNHGTSFTQILPSGGGDLPADIHGLDISPNYHQESQGGSLLVSFGNNLVLSRDGGTNWVTFSLPPGTLGVGWVNFSPVYNEDETDCSTNPKKCTFYLWLTTDGTTADIYKDNDQNEATSPSLVYDSSAQALYLPPRFAFSPDYLNDGIVYAAFPNLPSAGGGVFWTQDDGSTWQAINTNLDNQLVFDIAISPNYFTDKEVWVVGPDGLFRSTSYASSSQAVTLTLDETKENIPFAYFNGNGASIGVPDGGADFDAYISNNGGATWERLQPRSNWPTFHFFSSQGSDLRLKFVFQTTTPKVTAFLRIFSLNYGNHSPNQPSLNSPANGLTDVSLDGPGEFRFQTTDWEGQKLTYIFYLFDENYQKLWTFDQAKDPTGWSKNSYSSGEEAVFKLPSDFLNPQRTYYWRVRARDANGALSPLSPIRSFTTRSALHDLKFTDTTFRSDTLPFKTEARWGDALSKALRLQTQVSFSECSALGSGNTRLILPGDFDGDGLVDVLVVNDGSETILYKNNGGAGCPSFSTLFNFGTINPKAAKVADLDNDGDLDIVFAFFEAQNKMYLNNGAGSFTSYDRFGDNCQVLDDGLEVGDFNGDGLVDVFLGCDEGSGVDTLYLNQGGTPPVFEGRTGLFGTNRRTSACEAADIDQDGDLDLIVGYLSSSASLFVNRGNGTFDEDNFGTNQTIGAFKIVKGDLRSDGYPDFFLLKKDAPNSVIAINNYTPYQSGNYFLDLESQPLEACGAVIANFDNSGDLGGFLVAGTGYCHSGTTTNYLVLNQGIRQSEILTLGDDDSVDAQAADLNGDGLTDLLLGNNGQNKIFLNTSGSIVKNSFYATTSINWVYPLENPDREWFTTFLGRSEAAGKWYYIYRSHDSNQFAYLEVATNSVSCRQAKALDFDFDGDYDLICATANETYLIRNDTACRGCQKEFTFVQLFNKGVDSDGRETLQVVDIDQDNDYDIILGSSSGSCENYLFRNNNGSWQQVSLDEAGKSDDTLGLTILDIDGDGDLDIVAANQGSNGPGSNDCHPAGLTDGQAILYRNDGTGNFNFEASTLNSSDDRAVASGDLNSDGQKDLVFYPLLAQTNPNLKIFFNQEGRSFVLKNLPIISGDDGFGPRLHIDDFNNDGRLDIAANAFYFNQDNGYSWVRKEYLSTGGEELPYLDLNGDGLKDRADASPSGFVIQYATSPYKSSLENAYSLLLAETSQNIQSASLSVLARIPTSSSVLYYLSNDDGAHWTQADSLGNATFNTSGKKLRVKFALQGGSNNFEPETPLIYKISVSYTLGEGGGGGGGCPTPLAPYSGTTVVQEKNSLRFAWNIWPNSQADGFKFFRTDNFGQPTEYIATFPPSSELQIFAEDFSLNPASHYPNYCLKAYRNCGSESICAPLTEEGKALAWTLAEKPNPPALTPGKGTVTIKINDPYNCPGCSPNPTEYAILETTTNKFVQEDGSLGETIVWQTKEGWGGNQGFVIKGLNPGTTYIFKVKARNAIKADLDEYSLPQQVTTLLAEPKLSLHLRAEIIPQSISLLPWFLGKINYWNNLFILFLGLLTLTLVALVLDKQPTKKEYFKKLSFLPYLFFAQPALAFQKITWREEDGSWARSYSDFKIWRTLSRSHLFATLTLLLIKGFLVIGLTILNAPVWEIKGSAPLVYPGDKIKLTTSIRNDGEGKATNLSLSLPLPSGFEALDQRFQMPRVKGERGLEALRQFQANYDEILPGQELSQEWLGQVTGVNQTLVFQAVLQAKELANPIYSEILTFQVGQKEKPEEEKGREEEEKPTPETTEAQPREGVSPSTGASVSPPVEAPALPPSQPSQAANLSLNLEKAVLGVSGQILTNQNRPLFQGRLEINNQPAPSGTLIEIYLNNNLVGTTQVINGHGNFIWQPEKDLPEGEYLLEAKSIQGSLAQLNFILDKTPPRPILLQANVLKSQLKIQAETRGVLKNIGKALVDLEILGHIEDEDWQRGIKEAKIIIQSPNQIIETFVPKEQNWRYQTSQILDPGEHEVSLILTDLLGNVSPPSEAKTFQVVLPACADGQDNDHDGKIDFPADPGCANFEDNDETDLLPYLPEKVSRFLTSQTAQVIEFVQKPEVQEVNKKVVAPTLIGAAALNTALAASSFNFLNYLYYLYTLMLEPLQLLARKKRRAYGIVYNSLTKKPVDLAIVRVKDAKSGRLVQTKVTDRQGRYSFIIPPGSYLLDVSKTGFVFPSVYLKGQKEDVGYLDLYFGTPLEIKEGEVISLNIPLDPLEKKETLKEVVHKKRVEKVHRLVAKSGTVLAGCSFVITFNPWFGALFLAHLLLYFMFARLARPKAPKSWGQVLDAQTGKPIKLAVVRIFEVQYNKLLETQVTDGLGRYAFLVGANRYYLTFEKPGYQTFKTEILDLTSGQKEVIGLDIRLNKEKPT